MKPLSSNSSMKRLSIISCASLFAALSEGGEFTAETAAIKNQKTQFRSPMP